MDVNTYERIDSSCHQRKPLQAFSATASFLSLVSGIKYVGLPLSLELRCQKSKDAGSKIK